MHKVIEALRRAALARPDGAANDGELLDRFLLERDEEAFAGLVRRHGPMVLGVCRRILRHSQDAEDAFQATFLVLIRKAASIAPRERVGNWLYGVARTTARKARTLASRRQVREQAMPTLPDLAGAAPAAVSDEEVLLERELAALPEKLRAAILLCDVQGLSRAEAAAQLGCGENTLSSRLARGRQRLAERLGRQGLALPAGALPLGATLPAGLVQTTTQAASALVAGTATTGAISAPVLALMEGVLQAMVPLKLKFLAAVVLTVGAFGFAFGAGQGLLQGPKSAQVAEPIPATPVPAAPAAPKGAGVQIRDQIVPLLFHGGPGGLQFEIQGGQRGQTGPFLLELAPPKKGTPQGVMAMKAVMGQPNAPIPPELIRLLVKENDPEKRKLIGQLIESYQHKTIVIEFQMAGLKLEMDNKANPKAAALKKSEEAVRKLREGSKDKTPEAEVYDALLQAIQKLKTEPKK